MLYYVTVVVSRRSKTDPAGVFRTEISIEISAVSWAQAAELVTDGLLDKLLPLTGSPVGCTIESVEIRAVK